jgi:large subunit ribosomal protein L4
MIKTTVKKKATVKKSEKTDKSFNTNLVYQVAVSQISNRRKSIAHTKNRGEVSGGGKKPWKQKGTGRARHGSIRSPLWVGGGVTFGPRNEKNYKKTISKNVRRKALLEILEEKKRNNDLIFVDKIEFLKTKEAVDFLKKNNCFGNICLVVLKNMDKNTILSFRNIPKINTIQAKDLNCLDVLTAKNIIMTEDCYEEVNNIFSKK